ncbi:unnamed protein product, partial [Hapterophycus canaliculatus]
MPRVCKVSSCSTVPSFNHEGSKVGMYCSRHAEDGMVDVQNKRCAHPGGCEKQPTFNHKGSKVGMYCSRHAEDGM